MKTCSEKKTRLRLSIALLIIVFCGWNTLVAQAFEPGEYIQLGSYNDEPILWRCIDNLENTDEIGTLLISEKILCFKAFDAAGKHPDCYVSPNVNGEGCNFWETSNLRAWLNSMSSEEDVVWPCGNPPTEDRVYEGKNAYANEKGFLADGNFTSKERSLIRTVSQWIELAENKTYLSTNDIENVVNQKKVIFHQTSSSTFQNWELPQINSNYPNDGARYQVIDKMFLPDMTQISRMYNRFEDVIALPAKTVSDEYYQMIQEFEVDSISFFLRTPSTDSDSSVLCVNKNVGFAKAFSGIIGVRPAFYLNEDIVVIKGGSGTEDDPYVIDGPEESMRIEMEESLMKMDFTKCKKVISMIQELFFK